MRWIVTIVLLFEVAGCGAPNVQVWPEARPLGRGLASKPPGQGPVIGETTEVPQPKGTLTLRDVLRLTLAHNPELAVRAARVRAAVAEAEASGGVPNPELGLELEDWLGSGVFSGVRAVQMTVRLSQVVELGGKRGARLAAAHRGAAVAGWDYEVARVALLGGAATAFVELLAAQSRLEQAKELAGLAWQTADVFGKSEAAGRASALDRSRAEVSAATADLELKRAAQHLLNRRLELASWWGGKEARFERAVGELTVPATIPALNELEQKLSQNPSLGRWNAEVVRRQAEVERADAGVYPDLTIEAGYRYANEPGDSAAVFGVSLPLPLWSRNNRRVEAAKQRLVATRARQRGTSVSLHNNLRQVHAELAAAHAEAQTIGRSLLTRAEQNHRAVRAGQAVGRFGILEVLDAQRSLSDLRRQRLAAVIRLHKAATTLESLLGEPLEFSPNAANPAKGDGHVQSK